MILVRCSHAVPAFLQFNLINFDLRHWVVSILNSLCNHPSSGLDLDLDLDSSCSHDNWATHCLSVADAVVSFWLSSGCFISSCVYHVCRLWSPSSRAKSSSCLAIGELAVTRTCYVPQQQSRLLLFAVNLR